VTPVGSLVYASRLDPLEPTFSAFGSSTSRSYSNLALGDYTFHVKAQDQAGNEDSTPATRSFTVSEPPDTTPPQTTIVSGPSGTITETTATFTFTSSDDVTSVGNLVYASRLNPLESSFTSFSSPTSRSYSDLAPNDYTFQVKARDEAGNEDPSPATQSFAVTEEQEGEDTTPPQTTITSGPSGTISRSSATFTFTGSDNITPIGNLVYASQLVPLEQTFSTFSNSNSRTFMNLSPGDYTFRVKARDQEGNEDPSPAARSFRVDARILIANFMNGNDALFNSRIYFWNPSDISVPITARVFTLPLTGASTLLGTVELGNLEVSSARIIKLAEDILTPLAIEMPYTDNGGNLTIEFTIVGEKVRGVAQVFSSNLAFGTYPLQEIPSTPNENPTVLVANFLNGNNEALNSRVYLWNPSASSAAITVRVFTLLRGGPSTLLGTVDLGLLEGKSARNIKIAEDVLFALGIPLPYTADGGNLTVEFTVGAENVRGVAQVFSSDLAFGTYPMQVIP